MAKYTMTINPVCIPNGFDLGKIIYEKLNTASNGWLYSSSTSSQNLYCDIARKIEKNSNFGYGFRINKWTGANNGGIELAPALYSFSGETMTLLESIWCAKIYGSSTDPKYTKTILSDLTIFIGKHQKCYSVSVTPHDSGYVLMSAICGEDANRDPYILFPGIRPSESTEAMIFKSIKLDESELPIKTFVHTAYTNPNLIKVDLCMGLIDNNQKLVLAPFINPNDGMVCTDLYMPICGPSTSRVQDVLLGSRKFCTGSSNAPSAMGNALTDSLYQAYYKVFMEV